MNDKNTTNSHSVNRWRLPVILVAVLFITISVWLSVSSVGIASELGTDGQPLYENLDSSAVPQDIAYDAVATANSLFGEINDKSRIFIDELLAMYAESKDKDVLFIFNPGGWGSVPADRCKGWESIFKGMQTQLSASGVDSIALTYRRTMDDFYGRCKELMEIFTGYSSKAKELATRIEFLTSHNHDLKIVLTSESMGTLIGDQVMEILSDNPQVFSIQTGPPPWNHFKENKHTLIIKDNGVVPDSFSNGEIRKIILSSLAVLIHISQPDVNQGTILGFLQSPGHDYSWEYPAVSSQITAFLKNAVGVSVTR